MAAKFGHVQVTQILLDDGADINALVGPTTALGLAAGNGQMQMMRFLLERGADVKAHDCGEWGLDEAAIKGHTHAICPLLMSVES